MAHFKELFTFTELRSFLVLIGSCFDHDSMTPNREMSLDFLLMKSNGYVVKCDDNATTRLLSCVGRCGASMERKSVHKCFCDDRCTLLGDCCIDFFFR